MRRRGLVILLLSAALAGCSMEAATQVNHDGSGNLSTAIGLTPADEAGLADLGGGTSQDFCKQVEDRTRLPSGGTIKEEQRDGATWCVAEVPYQDLNQLHDLYQQIGNIDIRQLQLADGEFLYDVVIDLSDLSAEGVDPTLLDSLQLAIDWKLTLPGDVGDNNADQAQGGTLVWHLQTGQVNHLHAQSRLTSPTDQSGPTLPGLTTSGVPSLLWIIGLVLVCLLGLVLLGALVVVLITRSRRGPGAGT